MCCPRHIWVILLSHRPPVAFMSPLFSFRYLNYLFVSRINIDKLNGGKEVALSYDDNLSILIGMMGGMDVEVNICQVLIRITII